MKSYFVGVGLKDYPIYIGEREINEIIWNPAWIPPDSPWVRQGGGVRPGEIIKASDPRNPLGKPKMTLGDAYLIHEAQRISDLGNLVSHGCVRMLRADLYDLADKILAVRAVPVSRGTIETAKRSKRTIGVRLEEPVPVDINYDTIVIEAGVLHLYPDVYQRGLNTPAMLLAELEAAGVDLTRFGTRMARQMFSKVSSRSMFVVHIGSIERGRALREGRVMRLIPRNRRAGRS